MSETQLRLSANVADALAMLTEAQVALSAGDLTKCAQYLGRAEDAIDLCMPDLVAIAPDPNAAQAAFDNAKAGVDQ